MSARKSERLLNLLIALLVSRTYVTKQRLRQVIPDYRAAASDEASAAIVARWRAAASSSRGPGEPAPTVGSMAAVCHRAAGVDDRRQSDGHVIVADRTSSASTQSPTCFFHSTTVPSATETPICGIRISVVEELTHRLPHVVDLGQHRLLERG